MSNRPSICWKCMHREDCKMFNKNPEAKVTECGRFLMKDGDKAIMQTLYEHIIGVEIEPQKSDHKCHNCKHYTSGQRDGSCGSYICKHYSGWESEGKE